MKTEFNSRQQASILVLSLMFHALLLIAIFMIQQQQEAQEKRAHTEPIILIEEEQRQAENKNIPHDMPQQEWVAIESASPQASVATTTDADVDQSLQEMPAKEEVAPQTPTSDMSTEEEMEEKNNNAPIPLEAITDALQVAQQVLDKPRTTIPTNKKPVLAPKKDITPQKNSVKSKESVEQNKVTFAQLAQGFAQHVQATLSVKSSKGGTASIDQLKQIHYCQKILACLVNSYKINKGSLPMSKKMGNTVIQLALNKNGSIYLLKMLQSSGNILMDSFIMHMFQDASSSFPPLPASFQTPYQLPVFNFDTIEVFQSTNYWHIDTSRP